jgi:hypothetical protein
VRLTELPLAGLAELLDPEPDPHPAFTASVRPSPAEVFRAALEFGWLSPEPFLKPAVPLRLED